MVNREGVNQARYRLKMARQNLRHAKVNVAEYRSEVNQAKLALKDAKIQVREHVRRGSAVTAYERSRRKGFFESKAAYERRMRLEKIEEAPLR